MKLNTSDLKALCEIAIVAAQKAGSFISSYNLKQLKVKFKETDNINKPQGGSSIASQVVTEVDIKSQEIILNELNPSFEKYDLGLLTEEIKDDESRFTKDYFWCIDPLDGTLPFTEGLEGYSVSIALVDKKGTPVIGVVCNPITQDVYHAIFGVGAFKNNEIWLMDDPSKNTEFTFINDRSFFKHKHYKEIVSTLNINISQIGCSAFKMIKQGGAVMNAIWVLEKNPACYFKLPKKENGGGSIWDFAATACIYRELGYLATDFMGNPLSFNPTESTFMNKMGVIYSTNQELTNKIKSFAVFE